MKICNSVDVYIALGDAPEQLRCAIDGRLMRLPARIAGNSTVTFDEPTIARYLKLNPFDPYTRLPTGIRPLVRAPELQRKADQFRRGVAQRYKEMGQTEAWAAQSFFNSYIRRLASQPTTLCKDPHEVLANALDVHLRVECVVNEWESVASCESTQAGGPVMESMHLASGARACVTRAGDRLLGEGQLPRGEYTGEWRITRDGYVEPHGFGSMRLEDGKLVCSQWVNGLPTGDGAVGAPGEKFVHGSFTANGVDWAFSPVSATVLATAREISQHVAALEARCRQAAQRGKRLAKAALAAISSAAASTPLNGLAVQENGAVTMAGFWHDGELVHGTVIHETESTCVSGDDPTGPNALGSIEWEELAEDRARYLGQIVRGAMHGLGVLTERDGSRTLSRWKHNRAYGEGLAEHADGSAGFGVWRVVTSDDEEEVEFIELSKRPSPEAGDGAS